MKIAPDDCALCPNLVAGRHCVVHGQGAKGGVMIVGQHASTWEDEHGFPFAGKPGLMLRHFLDNAGIPAGKVYRTNVLKCATPGGKKQRKPSKAELDACHAYLMQEIEEVKPKVIVTLGDAALQALYGGTDTSIFKQELEDWQMDYDALVATWQEEIDMWGVATKAERATLFVDGKPKKPKPTSPKPKPPKATHTALKDVAGHTLIQPETGIPMVATYHPSFISHGKWGYVDPVAEHFKKAGRILTGQQKAGQLGEYAVIGDLDTLEALHDYLLSDEVPIIWFDCETFGGLDWMENEILCFSFSGAEGEGFVVPLWHHDDITGKAQIWPAWQDFGAIEWFGVVELLRHILGSNKPKGGHNVLYDIRQSERDVNDPFMGKVLTALGLKVNGRIIDTELESVAVEESLPHNMTFMLASKTDMPFYETGITAMKKAMDKAPDALVHEYSAADADGLPRLHKPLRKQIDREGVGWVLDNITTPMLKVCRTLETNGFPIDKPHFNNLCVFYDEQINLAEEELWGCVLHLQPGWKYNHSATLARVLFQDLNLPPSGRKTEAGKGCEDCDAGDCDLHDQTGKAALEDIMRAHPHPVLPILLRLKRLTKMRSTYLHGSDGKSGFLKHIRADGRVHPTYKVSRAETGRLASEKPNGQNMPNYVHIHPAGAKCSEVGCKAMYTESFGINSENAYHDVIKSDKPGWWIMNADWSQAEVWVLAYRLLKYTGDRTLLDVLLSGVDIHLWMARQMFPEIDPQMDDGEWRKTHPKLRRRAKTCIFGIGYGLTVQGYMQREHCTEEEAEDIISRYMARIPGLKKLFAMVRHHLETQGYEANEFGRRRHITSLPLLQALRERGELEKLVREAINFPIQSGASDLHSIATYCTWLSMQGTADQIQEAISQAFVNPVLRKYEIEMILTVHDSLSFEFKYETDRLPNQTKKQWEEANDERANALARIIKDMWESIAERIIKSDGTPLGWKIPVEVEWGPTWGTPKYKVDARGTLQLQENLVEEKETYDQKFGPDDDNKPTLIKKK